MHRDILTALAHQVECALQDGAPREEIADLVSLFIRTACEHLRTRDDRLRRSGASPEEIAAQLRDHAAQMEILRSALDDLQRRRQPAHDSLPAFLKAWTTRWSP